MTDVLLAIGRISVVLGAALVSMPLLRRQSAALRAWILTSAFGCAALVPLLQAVAPSWGLRFDAANTLAGSSRALDLILIVWLVGVAAHLFVLIVGMVRLMGIAAAADPIREGRCADLALDIAAEYRVHAPVLLLEADSPTLPVTWGHTQPKILLPPSARDWPDERLRIVLRHEMAHVRRRDWLVQMLTMIVRSIFWLHPLVWLVSVRLRLEIERACDDAVLRSGVSGQRYASHLLELARGFMNDNRSAHVALVGRSTLERRVRAMLTSNTDRSPLRTWRSSATALVMLSLTAATTGVGTAVEIVAAESVAPPHRLTLLLDGRIVDLSKGWPTYPDPRAGLVEGPGLHPSLRRP
jgi:beta-lactamase regulating signal transducer with metallopeptidase domain